MMFEIDKEILKKTTDCAYNFKCLEDGGKVCCKVEHCVNNHLIFVKAENHKFCAYKLSFGNSFICNCPTRLEIYNKYGV